MREHRQFGLHYEPKSGYDSGIANKEYRMVKPWIQRSLIALVVTLMGSGIIAFTQIIITNLQTVTRIEQNVNDMSKDFDAFVNLRYQSDIDSIDRSIADIDRRVDGLHDEKP